MKRIILLCLTAVLLLSGSGGLLSAAAEAKWPEGSKSGRKSNGKMTLDLTNVSEGYFMAAVSEKTGHNMKLRVVKDDKTLTYDLNNTGEFEVFPLQLGSGKYDVSLYENVTGKKYSSAGKIPSTSPSRGRTALSCIPINTSIIPSLPKPWRRPTKCAPGKAKKKSIL